MIARTVLAASLLGLAAFAQPAFAQQSRAVTTADLDLSTPEGQARLDGRIRAAARDVCQIDMSRVSLQQEIAKRSCYQAALDSARTRVAVVSAGNGRSRQP